MIGMNAKLWGAAALIALSVPLAAETAAENAPGGPPAGDEGKDDRTERVGNLFSGSMMPEMPSYLTISNEGPLSYIHDRKTFIFEGAPQVHIITDTGLEVFADRAEVDAAADKVFFKGNLSIYQHDSRTNTSSLTRAGSAEYDRKSDSFTSDALKTKVDGMILRSGNFEYRTDEKGQSYLEAFDASITAEDVSDPLTWISADRIRVYPEDRFSFKNLTLHYGGVPFFYFPYLSHSLNPEVGYLPMPGVRSIWGPYLLNEYGFLLGNRRVENHMPSADYLGTLHLDYRTRRGFAYGLDIRDVPLEERCPDMTGLSVYMTRDRGAKISAGDDEYREHLDPDRWRLALQQMWSLRENALTEWRLKANVNMLSDEYMLRDFYPEIYQRNSSPDNTVLLSRTDDTNDFSLLHRFVPNNFYMADQRTELSYERIKSPIFRSPVMYESRTSFAFLKQYVPPFMRTDIRDLVDRLEPGSPAYDYWARMLMTDGYSRFHTFHEFSASHKIMGFLNLTPKVGGGYTGYYDTGDNKPLNQGIFYAGTDADFKFSRRYSSVYSDSMGLNGMNHIVQPHFTLAYVKTNTLHELYHQIDGDTPTTNPPSLSMGRYTEIDSLSSGLVFRYGLRNMLMTSRDANSHRWFSWDVFMDAYLYDPVDRRDFSNLFSFMRWNPVPWMEYRSEMQAPLLGRDRVSGCREYNNSLRFMPWRSTEISVGHRYLNQHALLEDNSQLDLRILQRFSEAWAFSGKWRFSLLDGKLDIQEYNMYHNMGSWYLGVGVFVRKNGGRNEFGLGISFTIQETGDHMPVKFL